MDPPTTPFPLLPVFNEWASVTEPDDTGYSLPIDDDPDLPLPMCLSSGSRHVEIRDFVSTEELLELAGYCLP
ncbi:hypothetical protein AKJ16_DCAP17945 [Drosera capensis]